MRRPIHFMVVVWGEEFCKYFLQFCLGSLLAPGNIPRLCDQQDCFLIATTAEDRERMSGEPQIVEAQRHLRIEFVEIDRPGYGVASVLHSNKHLVRLLDRAWQYKAYGVMLSPDEIFSRELGGVLRQAINDGIGLLLLPTIRLAQEPLFDALMKVGVSESRANQPVIDLPSRTLAGAAIASLHPEILAAEWRQPYFGDFVNSVFWRVGEHDGILLHTFSFIPLLLDYSLVKAHDMTDALISNTDGPYLARNFRPGTPLRVIDDANTVFTVSWAPSALARVGVLKPKLAFSIPWLGQQLRGAFLRKQYYYYAVECRDWIKAKLFAQPIMWRLGGRDEDWTKANESAKRTLEQHLPGYGGPSLAEARAWSAGYAAKKLATPLRRVFDWLATRYQRFRRFNLLAMAYWAVTWSAICGQAEARKRIKARLVSIFQNRAIG